MPALLRHVHAFDKRLIDRVAGTPSPVLDRVLPPLGEAANFSRLWLGISAVLAVTGPVSARRGVVRGLAAVAVASATANVLAKGVSRRVRPEVADLPAVRRVRRSPVTTSFPSGHAASAAAFTTGVCLEAPAFAVPLGVLAAGVAASRVVTGAHYPSDVGAGVLLGAAVAVLTLRWRPAAGPGRWTATR
jgi:membrane-associated phospholipid phosphatase